jgi:hypothetical protein
MSKTQQKRKSAALPRFGRQTPLHKFILNPYVDARFTTCPRCNRKMRQRKLPLMIHVKPMSLVAINKTCRYCTHCDLLIAHQDELEPLLAAFFTEHKPKVASNDYLVIGTLDRDVWRRGVVTPLTTQDVIENLHDFKEVLKIEVSGGWVRE